MLSSTHLPRITGLVRAGRRVDVHRRAVELVLITRNQLLHAADDVDRLHQPLLHVLGDEAGVEGLDTERVAELFVDLGIELERPELPGWVERWKEDTREMRRAVRRVDIEGLLGW